MENRHENTSSEQQQTWQTRYVPPPSTHYQNPVTPNTETVESNQTQHNTSQAYLCERVQEKLQALIENDPQIKPEMATALYGHLAVCADCVRVYESLKRVVELLDSIPMMELPVDYSLSIMRKIEEGNLQPGASPRPTYATSSLGFGGVAEKAEMQSTPLQAVASPISVQERKQYSPTNSTSQGVNLPRMLMAVALAATIAFLSCMEWGRAALAVNIDAVRTALQNLGGAIEAVPLLGDLVKAVTVSLLQIEQTLAKSLTNFPVTNAFAAAIQTAVIFAVAHFLIVTRRANARQYS